MTCTPDAQGVHAHDGTAGRGVVLDARRAERFLGRIVIAGIGVGGVLALHAVLISGPHIDILWIAMIAAVLLSAVLFGFMASVMTAILAAAAIDVWVLAPRGTLLGSSAQDLLALGLFLVVALGGAAFASRSPRSTGRSRIQRVPAAVAADPLIEPLTDRELEIVGLLSRGLSNTEIAREFSVSPNTVKTHLEHVYGKLNVPSRGRAVAEAGRRGLLPAPIDRIVLPGDGVTSRTDEYVSLHAVPCPRSSPRRRRSQR